MLYLLVVIFLITLFYLIKKIYDFTLYDARLRKIENPKLWAWMNASGNNSVFNTFLYWRKRKDYPIEYSEEESRVIKNYKKKITALVVFFFIIGIIIFVFIRRQ